MSERWRRIPQFPQYEVSTKGRLRKYLKGTYRNHLGYVLVGITQNKKFWVHQLVMWAFRGRQPCGYDINHKDGNPSNNFLCNLEYIPHAENVRRGRATKLTKGDVRKIRKLAFGGWSHRRIAKLFPVGEHQIHMIVRRKSWKNI